MLQTKRSRWLLLSTLAGAAAAQAAEFMLTTGWRRVAGTEPPDDPTYEDVDWKSAAIWAAAAATAVALSQLLARQGAAAAWRSATGRRPPGPKRRKRLRSA